MNRRLVTALWAAAIVLFVAAAVLTILFDVADGPLAFAISTAGLATVLGRGAAKSPVAAIEPEHAAELRTKRDTDGEVAAVRSLRSLRPELGLVDAVKMVREL